MVRSSRSRAIALAVAAVVVAGANVSAHRLDELLQAARIGIGEDRIDLELDLTPGVAVADRLVAAVDRDGNGSLSNDEQRAFVDVLLDSMDVTADDRQLQLSVKKLEFATPDDFRTGNGVIAIAAAAPLAQTDGAHRIHFNNRYQRDGSVYLANALVPDSSRIAVTAQRRDGPQSELTIEYRVAPEAPMYGQTLAAGAVYGSVGVFVVALIVLRRTGLRRRPAVTVAPSA